jgi:transcriptional accessory protein Tex/SPT6
MSQWAEFLRKLNPSGDQQLVATWRMSDGQSLKKAIPAAEQIGEEEFASDPEFRYKLYETLELEFAAGDFDAIEQAARTSGLIYRRKPDRIIVRSPYTC